MKTEINEVEINGTIYVKKGTDQAPATNTEGMPYCIIRTYSAGVFAGYLKSRIGKEVELVNARRLWYWSGAASLSQLAMEGVKNPDACKFPCEVKSIILTEAIEVSECAEAARQSISEVKVWEK